MSRRILFLVTFFGTIALVGCCQDWDPAFCTLLAQSHRYLCNDPTFANTTCKRFCGNCPLLEPLECYSCLTPVKSPDNCSTTLTCALGEVCMTKQHKASDGHNEYIMKCGHKSICDETNSGFDPSVVGKRRAMFDEETEKDLEIHGRQDRSVTIDCCDKDLCNMPVATTTTTTRTTTTSTTTSAKPTSTPILQTTLKHTPTSSHSTNGPSPTTTPHSTCYRDVAFLVDSSGSVGSANFNTALGFINDVIAGLPIGPMGTLTSLMTFSTTPIIQWYFEQSETKQATTNKLASIPYEAGNTRTDLALHIARTQLLTPEHGDRRNASNVVIVLTDGKSIKPTETAKQANDLKTISLDVITVFIGQGPDTHELHELQTIATDQKHMFTVDSFQHLSTLQSQIHQLVCSG